MDERKKSKGMLGLAIVLVVVITLGHYTTNSHDVVFHNVYRRLYYLPVVLSAFGFGLRGGILCALACSLAYIPHAFLISGHHHHDPAPMEDKAMEIGLYMLVGTMTGWLVERQNESRRKLERSLKERDQLERQLVRAGRLSALGELLAGVAHELRNPLAAILGAAEALERDLDKNPRHERLVGLQLRELKRLDRVVKNFLMFAQDASHAPQSLLLGELLEEVIQLAGHRPERVRFEGHKEVGKHRVFADRDQLVQVLLNVVLNAIFASEGEDVHVRFLWEEQRIGERTYARIGVQDDGPGIAPEHLEEVFNPYFTTRPSGSGLGLSISSSLVDAHEGFLDVESVPGCTTFWISLPHRGEV